MGSDDGATPRQAAWAEAARTSDGPAAALFGALARPTAAERAAAPRERSQAEQRHADATDARQVVTRLLGWPMGATARAALRDALDVIDGVDREAIRQMRADAEAKGVGLRVEFRGAAS